MKRFLIALAAVPVLIVPASADDPPGLYLEADGAYRSVGLGAYELGLVRSDVTGVHLGPLTNVSVRVDAFEFAGTVGYRFHDTVLDGAWGSNARIELGAAITSGDGSNSGSGIVNFYGQQMMSGATDAGGGCFSDCPAFADLESEFESSRFSVALTTDHGSNENKWSPVLEIFGGSSDLDQDFESGFSGSSPLYNASTSLDWDHVGARLGIATDFPVAENVKLGIGAKIGAVHRDAEFSGSDTYSTGGSSTASGSDDTVAFLFAAEANANWTVASNAVLRVFGGVEYDSAVPVIAAASYEGDYIAPTSTTPAHLDFEDDVSFYAGLGLTISLQ